MPQNISNMAATGTYSDSSTADLTNIASWTSSDSTILSINAGTGAITIQPAGKIWGGDVGITATLAPGTPGTASLLVIASDSGSVAPRMPQQDNHWVALGLSPWGSYWGCQELTGNLVGSGSNSLTLNAVAAGLGDSVGGLPIQSDWTRNGITFGNAYGARFSAALPSGQSSGSFALLAYVKLTPASTTQFGSGVLGIQTNTPTSQYNIRTAAAIDTPGCLDFVPAFKPLQFVGPLNHRHDDRVHPILMVFNSASQEFWGYTDNVIMMSASTVVPFTGSGFVGIGSQNTLGGAPPASASYTFLAYCTGALAESLCVPLTASSFLTKLGWNVSWGNCPIDSGTIKLPFLVNHWKELGLIPWTATWNFQEGSGNPSSFNSWNNYNVLGWRLTAQLVASYRSPLASWTRRGITFSKSNDAKAINTAVVAGAVPSFDPTGSFALLTYMQILSASANDTYLGVGVLSSAPASAYATMVSGGKIAISCAGANNTGSITVPLDRVHPYMFVYDKTNSMVKLYNDLEVLTGTFNALTLQNSLTAALSFGACPAPGARISVSGTFVYGSFCTGALAESLSDDTTASLFFKSLGWSPTW